MLQPSGWVLHLLVIVLSVALGAGCHLLWTRHQAKARRRVPKYWPVDTRRIVTHDEGAVWRFLVKTFPEHQVMVKLPFTRFTIPRDSENKAVLFEHLSKVYCTFTISTREGRIIGCVDVGGRKSISRSNQLLKLSLLSQCDICYWTVEHHGQLRAEEMRAYFLDAESPRPAVQPSRPPELTSAQDQLRGVVERQRQQRRNPGKPGDGDPGEGPSSFGGFSHSDMESGSWQTRDSFIAPLETRPGKLQ